MERQERNPEGHSGNQKLLGVGGRVETAFDVNKYIFKKFETYFPNVPGLLSTFFPDIKIYLSGVSYVVICS